MDYEKYKKEVDLILEENKIYIKEFREWLEKKGLADKTIKNHVSNADFYINDYLNYCEPTKMDEGCYLLDRFLGDWFIRKCMWSTASSVKSNATSIKKFYECMLELGYIEKDGYDYIKDEIKESLKDWVYMVEEYNSGSDDFFSFL